MLVHWASTDLLLLSIVHCTKKCTNKLLLLPAGYPRPTLFALTSTQALKASFSLAARGLAGVEGAGGGVVL